MRQRIQELTRLQVEEPDDRGIDGGDGQDTTLGLHRHRRRQDAHVQGLELAARAQIEPAHAPVPRPDHRDPRLDSAKDHAEEQSLTERSGRAAGFSRSQTNAGPVIRLVIIGCEVAIVGTEAEQDLPVQAVGGDDDEASQDLVVRDPPDRHLAVLLAEGVALVGGVERAAVRAGGIPFPFATQADVRQRHRGDGLGAHVEDVLGRDGHAAVEGGRLGQGLERVVPLPHPPAAAARLGLGERGVEQPLQRVALGTLGPAGLDAQPRRRDRRDDGDGHDEQARPRPAGRRPPGCAGTSARPAPRRPTGRAWIGSPARKRRRSSASAARPSVALAPAPSRRHFRQIVSRSRGTPRLQPRRRHRLARRAPARACPARVAAWNGGRPVSSS